MDQRQRTIIERARQRRQRRSSAGWLPLLLGIGLLGMCLGFALLAGLWGATQALEQPAAGLGSISGQPLSILLLGVDRRADESGPTRSDSMILLGSQPAGDGAALLSIPRDLWIDIPGVGEQRINTALYFGHDPEDAGAGPRLAVAAVQQTVRRPVDRYLLLDFATFVRIVDALGGIQVDVPAPIVDTEYPTPDYGITTIRFEPGLQTMDGERALVYVRTRHSDGDFSRSARQLQVLQALAAQAMQPATWPRLPEVYRVLREGVITDLTPADGPALLLLASALAGGQVNAATLEQATTPWITPGGAWVLLPDSWVIEQIVNELFGPG
ncbi:MAG: LCP family protein [Anaerolineae bacterium]|jgi:LCP family protein required for cell wall assembly